MENDQIFLFVFRSNVYGWLADNTYNSTTTIRTFATVEPVSMSVVKCGAAAGST